MKDNNFIEFKINGNKLKEIFAFSEFSYLNLYWLIHNSKALKSPKIENVITTKGREEIYELSYFKTIVKHLSWPYMSDCYHFESKSYKNTLL